MARATFAAGCFWKPEIEFRKVAGVTDAEVGYIGGWKTNPTYKEVCTGRTGHAEAVAVEFDPETVSYAALLEVFWRIHDPTTLNRQGPDVGTQYRSAIFVHDAEQRVQAESSRAVLQERFGDGRKIVTEIEDAGEFWRAEEYHQLFLEKQRRSFFGFRLTG